MNYLYIFPIVLSDIKKNLEICEEARLNIIYCVSLL